MPLLNMFIYRQLCVYSVKIKYFVGRLRWFSKNVSQSHHFVVAQLPSHV